MEASLSRLGTKAKRQELASAALAWWDANRRRLPWRAEPGEAIDPYRVWLSEVLLQQTTAQAVAPYFERFVAAWPRVEDLAAATPEAVISLFAGLGYYSRARNLHACAREIARRGGRFPKTEAELRALPGIGAYTAAAIAAIAFGEPAAPVDGNIARIVARLLALEAPLEKARATVAAAAAALVPPDRPGDFAQALMDLGATICRPLRPDCAACPLQKGCAALRSGAPEAFPRRLARKARPHRLGAAFFAQRDDGAFLARRRPPHGLLASTLELPGTRWTAPGPGESALQAAPARARWRRAAGHVEQAFTHFSLRLDIYVGAVGGPPPDGHIWIAPGEVATAGFSNLMRKAVKHALADVARAGAG
jgi:A/G-specific adenine glycosylase